MKKNIFTFLYSKKALLTAFIQIILISIGNIAIGQTNPAVFDLSSGNFSFTSQTSTNTTYPTYMQGWSTSANNITSAETNVPSADQTLVASGTNTTSGLSNLGTNGFQFISTGSNPNRKVGEICVALNTTGRTNILVTWTASDQQSGANYYQMGLALQYRVGTSGTFTTVSGTTYTSAASSQAAASTFTNIALPSACDNQSVVQIRWIYYQIGASGTSGRDPIRLDDITVSSSADYCSSTCSGTSYYINSFSTTGGSANISNTTNAISTNGYGNFTAQSVSNTEDNATNFTLTWNTTGGVGIGVWIDWNNDRDFSDANEAIYVTSSYNFSNTYNGTITIPAGTAAGSYRLRTKIDYNSSAPSSCGAITNGETEDYTFTVNPSCTQPTTQATIGAYTNNTTGNSITANWTRGNGTGGVLVVARLTATAAVTPTSGTSYTANAAFGSGNTTGTGNYVVYNGTGTSVNVTALTSGTSYTFDLYEYNTASTCYKKPASSSAVTTFKPEPTNQPTNFAAGTVTTTAVPNTWTAAVAGSQLPDGYLIKLSTVDLASIANPVDGTDPADVTTITANAANKKITPGTASSATTFSGMTAGTMYYFKIFSYTNSGTDINFKTTGVPTLYHASLPTAVTSATVTPTTSGTANITWTNTGYDSGNWQTLVFVKATSSVTTGTPTNNPTSYTANTAFGSGTAYQGDAAAYCVYNGDGTSVSITGLSATTTYYVAIYTVVSAANSNSTHSYSSAATGSGTTPCALYPLTYTQDFNASTSTPDCWSTSMSVSSTHGNSSTNGLYKNLYSSSTTCYARTPQVGPLTASSRVTFDYRIVDYTSYPATATTLGASDKIEVQVSTDDVTYTTIYTINSTTHTTSLSFANKQIPLGAFSGSNVYVKFVGTWGAGDYYLDIDNVVIENSVSPMISVGALTAFGNQCTNTTSAEKTYSVSGTNLTNNIIITPPANFEISLTSGSGFVANPSTITLTQTGGNVANTIIYTRFKPTAVQAYSGNITHTSTGAPSQNISLSGSGINSAPTISTPTSASITTTTAILGGNITATGCTNITERGIYWSTTSGFADGAGTKVSETAGAPYSTGAFTINVSGLTPATVYYYKAFATNAGGTVYTTQGTFTTQCDAYNPPYVEDFTSYVPSCWSEATGTLAAPTTLTVGSSYWAADGFANSGTTGAAKMEIWSTGYKDWLISPAVNLVAGNVYQLEFDLALTAWGETTSAETDGLDDKFAVVISTDGGTTWTSANALMIWDNDDATNGTNYRVYNSISNTATRIAIPLSAYTGQTIRIGFYGESTISNADNDLFIDNFSIKAITIPDCATQTAPANAATDICPGSGATLAWTKAATNTTASDFIIYFGTNNPPTNIVNGISIGDVTSYNTGPLTGNTTYYWKIQPATSVGINTSCNTVFSFTTSNVSTPSVTSPVTTCLNTATLSATGSNLYWYNVPTGGTSIGTGNSYNATFNGNTTYYVASQSGTAGSSYNVGKAAWDAADGYYGTSDWGICFTTSQALTVNSVDVYVQTAGSDVSVQFTDGSGVAIGSILTFTSLPAGKNTLALNTTLSTPGNYRLYSKNSTNLGRGSTNVSFPYTQSGVMSVTSSWWGDVYTTTNYFFYNFAVTTGGGTCQSARVPIVVNHTAEEITITPSGPTTFDQGGSVDLTASSTQSPAYTTYTWAPADGLNTTNGANVTTTPTNSTTYTVTGTNGTCTRTATIDINVILPCTGLGTGVTSISSLPYSVSGQTTNGMVNDITSSNATVCSSTNYYVDADVVYVFKPLVSGSITINLTSPSTYSGLMLYKGCPMSGQGGICASSSQSSTGDKSMCVNVEANENYYLVIDSYNSNDYIDYALSISAPNPGSTPNDLPCDALPVSLGGIVAGDNTCATGTGEPTTPSCWSSTGSINTLWFSVVAPASGSLKIRTLLGSLTNTQIALYQGSCNTLSLVTNGCNDDVTICTITSKQSDLSLTGLTAGATYYLAVDGYGDEVGTFSVMAIDGTNNWAPVPQQDCSSATVVCNVSTDVGNPGFMGSGNICDYPSGYGCLSSGEKNSAWYTINILNDGNFIFTITPVNSSTDYDWGLFEVTGISNPCSVINSDSEAPLIRCSYAAGGGATGLNATATDQSEDSGGDRWCQQVAVQAGDILMLNISNYSSNNSGFNLNMETSPVNYNQPTSVTWTGAIDSDWFKPANWGGCAIPSCTIDAVVVNGPAYQPVINAAGAACKSLQVINGATLTINAGRNLQLCGNFENLGVLNIDPTATITMDNGSTVQGLSGSLTGSNKLGSLTINKTGGEVITNQNLEIGGNLTTSSATSKLNTNGKEIIVGGNITLNTPLTYFNIGTTGSLEFNGTTAQTYSPGGLLTLNNVEIHNTSTGVTLNNDLILNSSGTLTLNSGRINTGIYKVLLNNSDPSAVNNGNATSYINGNLRRYIASNTGVYAFPIGTALAYRLAQISNNNMTGIAYFDSKFESNFTSTGSLNPSIAVDLGTAYSALASEGIWTISPDVQPTGGSYGINLWFDGGGSNAFSGLTDLAFGVLKRNTGATTANVWSSQGGTLDDIGRLVSDGYARRIGWTSFSEFAIGKASGALPVSLLTAQMVCDNNHKIIRWSTATEVNNQYFTILSSTNAIDFHEVARVNGAGNSNTTIQYQWIDTSAATNDVKYYQLKQTDYNGTQTSLSLLSGNCEEGSNGDIVIISNPGNPNIEARFTGDQTGKYTLKLVNYLGQVVMTKEVNLDKEGNLVFLPKKGLATGIYNLVFKNKKEVITKQVLVTY